MAAFEAAKEDVWLRKFQQDLAVVPTIIAPLKLFCDNSGVVAQSKEPQETKTYGEEVSSYKGYSAER